LTKAVTLTAAPVLLAFGMVVSATSPAGGQIRRCSNFTLYGDYGFTIQGGILGPNLELPGLAMQHYDGRGPLTPVDHVTDNGAPPGQEWTPGSGTYQVNPDCTGSAVINTPASQFPLQVHFVVVNQGREIDQVVDGNPVTAIGKKVD